MITLLYSDISMELPGAAARKARAPSFAKAQLANVALER